MLVAPGINAGVTAGSVGVLVTSIGGELSGKLSSLPGVFTSTVESLELLDGGGLQAPIISDKTVKPRSDDNSLLWKVKVIFLILWPSFLSQLE